MNYNKENDEQPALFINDNTNNILIKFNKDKPLLPIFTNKKQQQNNNFYAIIIFIIIGFSLLNQSIPLNTYSSTHKTPKLIQPLQVQPLQIQPLSIKNKKIPLPQTNSTHNQSFSIKEIQNNNKKLMNFFPKNEVDLYINNLKQQTQPNLINHIY